MQCPSCGARAIGEDELCPRCGAQLRGEEGLTRDVPAGGRVAASGQQAKNPNIAMALELAGYVGFLGIGHMYAGAAGRGILLLFAWWGMTAVTATLLFVGTGLRLLPVFLMGPLLSALWAKRTLRRRSADYRS